MVHPPGLTRKQAAGSKRPSFAAAALFVLPALLLFGLFLIYPLLSALSFSLFEWQGTRRGEFTGLSNFTALITELPYRQSFPNALWHNVLFFAGAMVAQNSVGLFLAVQLHSRPGVRRVLQTLYTMPYLVSPLVAGYLWTLLLSPSFGPVNALLRALGLDALALPWLGDPDIALWIIILIFAWQWIGFPVLIYGAALAGLAPEIGEAAKVDGATGWKAFRHVTFPMLSAAVGTVTVLTFIYAMEVFPLAFAIGGSSGSPAGATDVLGLLFYRTSFQSGASNALGMSSAVATVMFVIIFGTALAGTRALRRWESRLS